MRFQIGQTLFAVHFSTDDALKENKIRHFRQPLMYDSNMPVQYNFERLKVTEHHKVYWEYDDREKTAPKNDGYLLTDDHDREFSNQYPTAYFGQMSDEANRRFSRHMGGTGNFDKIKTANPNLIYSYHLLTDVLEKFLIGIRDLKAMDVSLAQYAEAQQKAALVEVLFKTTVSEFSKAYPGYYIDTKWKSLMRGQEPTWPEVTIYRRLREETFIRSSKDGILTDYKNYGRIEVQYNSGDRLRLQNTEGMENVCPSLEDSECHTLTYMEKISNPDRCAPESFNAHQTEFFHLADIETAVVALMKRNASWEPIKATNTGVSEEEIDVRQSIDRVKAYQPMHLVQYLDDHKAIGVKYAGNVKYELLQISSGSFALKHTQPATQNPGDEMMLHSTTHLPATTPEVAVKCFLKLIDNPPTSIDPDRIEALFTEVKKEWETGAELATMVASRIASVSKGI